MIKTSQEVIKIIQVDSNESTKVVQVPSDQSNKIIQIESKDKANIVQLKTDDSFNIVKVQADEATKILEIESDPIKMVVSNTGLRGPRGLPGAGGDSAQRLEKNFTALEVISALKLVKADGIGTILKGFNNGTYEDAKILGVSLNALSVGAVGPVLLFGLLEDPFFNFPINAPLYLGLDGEITLTPPASGVYTVIVGKGIGPGAIFIDIQEPILT